MINYCDYNFYLGNYKGSLSFDLFSFYIVKASRLIDRNINKEITKSYLNNLKEKDKNKIRYVACELCDYIYSNENGSSNISIDGVSISGKVNKDKNNEIQNILDNLPIDLRRYI